MKKLFLFLMLASVEVSSAQKAARVDRELPIKCAKVKLSKLARAEQALVVGSEGALEAGFDLELAMSADEAAAVQRLLSPESTLSPRATENQVNQLSSRARRLYHRARAYGPARGFTFEKKGEALEYLALEYFTRLYPKHVVTSGLVHKSPAGSGELDIVVMRPKDCSVVVIAEVKIGFGQLEKARAQLARVTSQSCFL